jgi:Smg protein
MAGVVRGPHCSVAPPPESSAASRAYAPRELAKLGTECRGLLMHFEQSAILSAQTREHVIERALAATGDELTVEQLKLIVLMVLWNQQTPTSRLIAENLLASATARVPS